MATAEEMKDKFKTGMKPTEADFAELIDEVDSRSKKTDLTPLAKKTDLTPLAKKTEVPTKVEYDALVARVEALEAT